MVDTHLVRELKRRMAAGGLSQKRLALAAGLNETAVRDIVSGRSRHPRHDTIEKLAAVLGCSAAELFDGRNGALARTGDSGDDYLLIARYDPARDEGRETLSHDRGGAAEIALRADWVAELTRTPVNQLAAIAMEGDSMAPTIGPGDTMIVDLTQWSPGADGIYVLRHGGRLLVRRLAIDPLRQLVSLASDNPSYAPLAPVTMAELDLVGRVIWVGKRV